jgi:hypothetical protein
MHCRKQQSFETGYFELNIKKRARSVTCQQIIEAHQV